MYIYIYIYVSQICDPVSRILFFWEPGLLFGNRITNWGDHDLFFGKPGYIFRKPGHILRKLGHIFGKLIRLIIPKTLL